jgi:hypothetical protein
VRTELVRAIAQSAAEQIQFPVGQVTLQFQVGVTKSGRGAAGVDIWVAEFGAGGEIARETIQTITVVLEPPLDANGRPIKVASASGVKPK